jgi:hypothetical protein
LKGKEKIQFKAQSEAKNEAIIRERTMAGKNIYEHTYTMT